MEITDNTLKSFITWYKSYEPKSDWKMPAIKFFENHSFNYKVAVLTEFYDDSEIFTKVEPHIGGGAPAFYGSLIYRRPDNNVDVEDKLMNGGEEIYFPNRFDACEAVLNYANKTFNEIYLFEETLTEEEDFDNLPF